MTTATSIALDAIAESKTNPRRSFDKEKLAELTESIRQHGVLQPVLLRPGKNGKHELVAGARRYRGAKAAGLAEIPAVVRDLTDKEVLEIQVIENLQREDLHPLEEAEGYERLHKEHGYSVDDLAAKVGKSKGYIYGRMKLCALTKAGRKAFLDEKLAPSVALLIARVPAAMQDEALAAATKEDWDGRQLSFREVKDLLEEDFMTRLDAARFPVDDADLVPAAGACIVCPKRTGNQPLLFDDIKSENVCTDPKCFRSKCDAWSKVLLARAEQDGKKVLSAKESKEIFRNGSYLPSSGRFVSLDDRCWEDSKSRHWRAVIGKKDMPPIHVALDGDGNAHELVLRQDAMKVCEAKGLKWAQKGKKTATRHTDTTLLKRQQESRLRNEVVRRAMTRICSALETEKEAAVAFANDEFWRAFALGAWESSWHDTQQTVARRRGFEKLKRKNAPSHEGAALQEALRCGKVEPAQVRSLAFELVISRGAFSQYRDAKSFDLACSVFGVDVKAIAAEVRKDLAPKKTKKTPAKKKAAAKRKPKTFETMQEAKAACGPKQRVEVLDDGSIVLMPKVARKKAAKKRK